jgi:hypothetical protein
MLGRRSRSSLPRSTIDGAVECPVLIRQLQLLVKHLRMLVRNKEALFQRLAERLSSEWLVLMHAATVQLLSGSPRV